MNKDWILVDSDKKLKSSMEDILVSPLIGLDTEYDSFRYFREKLCLIQICTDSSKYIYDPLDDIDLSCLGAVFRNRGIKKVIHAAGNDIRFLNRDYGFTFHNIFDTHKASALLGKTSLSLPSVIEEYLGIEVTKTKKLQRSRWDIRPLFKEQLDYAARDTQYLMDLYRVLEKKLEAEGLQEKSEKAFSKISSSKWTDKTFDCNGHLRIEGYELLTDDQQERLKKLYRWRFEMAKETNRARFMIISDSQMVTLSQQKANSIDALQDSGILAPRTLYEWGDDIVAVLNKFSEESV